MPLNASDLSRLVTGRSEDHLIDSALFSARLHREVEGPLAELQRRARAAGFDLAVASGFRGFERQRLIWNEKASGRRPVLDDAERPIAIGELEPWSRVQAILRWSALPGASRHHWGTDLDIFDRAALTDDYPAPRLTAGECAAGGVFADFHRWLDEELARDSNPGFFRPYAQDRGGVACEAWHISYRPISESYQRELTPELLADCVRESDLALADTVLLHLNEIYRRFISIPA